MDIRSLNKYVRRSGIITAGIGALGIAATYISLRGLEREADSMLADGYAIYESPRVELEKKEEEAGLLIKLGLGSIGLTALGTLAAGVVISRTGQPAPSGYEC